MNEREKVLVLPDVLPGLVVGVCLVRYVLVIYIKESCEVGERM